MALAIAEGLTGIAITDHDTMSGNGEAAVAGAELGMTVIPGVEVSAVRDDGSELHLLGYWPNQEHEGLQKILADIRDGRDRRNARIVDRLTSLGVDISLEMVETIAGGESVGRPHIAQALVQVEAVSGIQEAFDRYLARGKPAYVDRFRLGPEEAVRLLTNAGSLVVLAHPKGLRASGEVLSRLVVRLVKSGLRGIEAYYSTHSPSDTKLYLDMADEYDLIATGGSDFHGANKPDVHLGKGFGGLKVPDALLEPLVQWRTS